MSRRGRGRGTGEEGRYERNQKAKEGQRTKRRREGNRVIRGAGCRGKWTDRRERGRGETEEKRKKDGRKERWSGWRDEGREWEGDDKGGRRRREEERERGLQ